LLKLPEKIDKTSKTFHSEKSSDKKWASPLEPKNRFGFLREKFEKIKFTVKKREREDMLSRLRDIILYDEKLCENSPTTLNKFDQQPQATQGRSGSHDLITT
jgi:hypothetical protein